MKPLDRIFSLAREFPREVTPELVNIPAGNSLYETQSRLLAPLASEIPRETAYRPNGCATDAIGAIGDASVEFAPAGVAESSGAGRFASGKFVGRPKRRLAGIGGFGECVAFPRGSVRIVARGAGGVGGVSLCGGRGARAIYAGIQPIDKDDTAMRSPVDETPDLSRALPE